MKNKIIIWSVIVLCLSLFIGVNCSKKKSPTSPQQAATTNPALTSTITRTSTATPTFTATIADNTLYGFETPTNGVMGWSVVSSGITGTANSTYTSYYGTHSLAVECNFTSSVTSGSLSVQPPSVTDFTGKMVVARIYIPSTFPTGGGGAIFLKTGTGYVWSQGAWVNYTTGQWNTLYYNPNAPVAAGTPTPAVSSIMAMGIQMSSGVYSGNLYMDAVDLITAPPNPSNTPIPSNTPGLGTPTNTPTVTATGIANSPSDPNIQYYGRWDKSDPANYRADWGNVYIKANFTGTSVGVNMWDTCGLNMYAYSIDSGAYVQMLANTSTSYALASGLANGSHSLTFMRLTDCQAATGSDLDASTNFWGFTSANGGTFATTAPPARPTRKMEIIGDSISVGTADECPTGQSCTNSNTNENGYLAFGPQTALQYNAEWRVEARGGLGVYHNWNETYPPNQEHAINYFTQTLYHFANPQWDFSTWQPNVVIIALGTNDCNGQWDTTSAGSTTTTAFEAAYTQFVNFLTTEYPSAYIFCMEPIPAWCMQYDGAGQGSSWTGQTYILTVVQAINSSHVSYLQLNSSGTNTLINPADCVGDNTHPTAAGHTKIVNYIMPEINTIMNGLW